MTVSTGAASTVEGDAAALAEDRPAEVGRTDLGFRLARAVLAKTEPRDVT
jgi:hypothetical protein